MASVSVYLNFSGNTKEAFEFYRSVFATEYASPIQRYSDRPPNPASPPITDEQQHWILHIALPLIGGFILMGSDVPPSMGPVNIGNNSYISLRPDTREETDRLFQALSHEGKVTMPLTDMFWGDYFGCLTDKFGVQWMLNYS